MEIEKPKAGQPLPENAKKVFEGKIFDVYQWQQEMFDGTFETFEKVRRIGTTIILAFDKAGKVIILDQEQPAKGRYLSLPGGMVDREEEVLESAKRELLEETGYISDDFRFWHSVNQTSKIEWGVYFFVAKN